MRLLSRKQEARARKMVKVAKRLSASAGRAPSFADEAARYKRADHLFMRAYSWLRFKS